MQEDHAEGINSTRDLFKAPKLPQCFMAADSDTSILLFTTVRNIATSHEESLVSRYVGPGPEYIRSNRLKEEDHRGSARALVLIISYMNDLEGFDLMLKVGSISPTKCSSSLRIFTEESYFENT